MEEKDLMSDTFLNNNAIAGQAFRQEQDALGEEWARERRDSPDIRNRIDRFRAAVQRKRDKMQGTNHEGTYLNGDQMDILAKLRYNLNNISEEKDPITRAALAAAEWVEYGISQLVRPQPGGYSPLTAFSYATRSLFINVHEQGKGKNPLFNELLAIVIEVAFDLLTDLIATRVEAGQPEDLIKQGTQQSIKGIRPDRQNKIVAALTPFLGELDEDSMTYLPQKYKNIKPATIGNFSKMLGYELTEEFGKAIRKGTFKEEDLKDAHRVALFINELLEKRLPGHNLLVEVPPDTKGVERQLEEAKRQSAAKDAEIARLKEQVTAAGKSGDMKQGRQAQGARGKTPPATGMGA